MVITLWISYRSFGSSGCTCMPERKRNWNCFYRNSRRLKQQHFSQQREIDTTWYKDAIVYSGLLPDLFNEDLNGLREKLPHLESLGVTCLWLLPILESPMKDAGFDISDFDGIRAGLPGDCRRMLQKKIKIASLPNFWKRRINGEFV